MSGSPPLVEAYDLEKVYPDGTVAVRGVSFRAGRGLTIFMGPNGSGKTTTLSITAGALRPTSGRVLVCGYDVWGRDWSRPRSCIGYAPQAMPFREKLSVIENLTWYGLIRGLPPWESRRRARWLLEQLGLEGLERKKVSELSGGQRRRLTIAASLIGDPEVLILDEPTSGLDPKARASLWSLLRRVAGDKAIIASTHIPDEAEGADYVYIFHRGRVVAEGAPGELIGRYARYSRVIVKGSGLEVAPTMEWARLVEAGWGRAVYVTEDPEEALPRLVERLLKLGARIERVEVRKPGLAEVFLAVTGEAPEGGA